MLLAAKLLLLSRLTHKTLSQRREAPPLVDNLRDRLASLRIKLLRAIDRRFADPERDVTQLVDDMCAFSLATSSTPSDVLQHFLKIRLRAEQWHLEQEEGVQDHVIKSMQLLLNTLSSTQAIFPKRLSDSLVRLKDSPLIKQADVNAVSELRLNIHAKWLADELQNYTPWPRHDELQKSEGDKMLKSWAKTAQKAFIAGLKTSLGKAHSFDDVLVIRQRLFETWPWTASRLPGLHSADVVDEVRDALNARLTALIQTSVAELKHVCELTRQALSNDLVLPSSSSLWDASLTDLDPGSGGQRFKSAILQNYHGIDTSKSAPLQAFDHWVEHVKEIRVQLKRMRDSHWDDDLGDEDDEMDSKQTLLGEDDPRTLDECLTQALQSSATTLANDFESITKDTAGEEPQQALMLLRILRETTKRAALQDQSIADVTASLTSDEIISPLHDSIAIFVSNRSIAGLGKALARLEKAPAAVGVMLWEGRPPLPAHPSAIAFKFLKTVTLEMAALGADIWSEAATDAVKTSITRLIAQKFDNTIDALLKAADLPVLTNGHKPNGNAGEEGDAEEQSSNDCAEAEKISIEKLTQLAMDISYLSAAFATKYKQQPSPLLRSFDKTAAKAGLGPHEKARVQKSGLDHWKRTYLLFALLAN